MDWNDVAAKAILALVPVVTMIVTWGVRAVAPKLPRVTIPFVAMALGAAISYLLQLAGGPGVAPLVAVLLGAAATWLREVLSTIQQHGTK